MFDTSINRNYQKLFNDKSYFIEKVDLNSENSVYRLQIGMFADEKAAGRLFQAEIHLREDKRVDRAV